MEKEKKPKQTEKADNNQIEELRAQADEYLNMAKYQKAEFENYKKRHKEAIGDALQEGRADVIIGILPLLDSLREGVKITEDKKTKEGLEIIIRKFKSVLESFDVVEYKSLGKPFDPKLHNAVAVEEVDEKPPDIVIEEWQRGYKLNGKVIRVAMVKVSK